MAASIVSFLPRIPFAVVFLTSMPHFLLISLASLDWFGFFFAAWMISFFSVNVKLVRLRFRDDIVGKIWNKI